MVGGPDVRETSVQSDRCGSAVVLAEWVSETAAFVG